MKLGVAIPAIDAAIGGGAEDEACADA